MENWLVLGVALFALLAGGAAPALLVPHSGSAPASTDSRAQPPAVQGTVLLLHGFAPTGAVHASWSVYEDLLVRRGWATPVGLAYYGCTTGADADVSAHGDHGHGRAAHAVGPCGTWGHTAQTPIEHLAFHFAWYVHDEFTTDGRCVDVLAHSQGGLIARYGWEAVERGEPGFPSEACLEDVVALGSPFDGLNLPRCDASLRSRQCEQMLPGSRLLGTFQADAPSKSATRWTLIASEGDTLVPPRSALAVPAHTVVRYAASENIDHFYHLGDPDAWDDRFVARVDMAGTTWQGSIASPALVAEGALRGELSLLVP